MTSTIPPGSVKVTYPKSKKKNHSCAASQAEALKKK